MTSNRVAIVGGSICTPSGLIRDGIVVVSGQKIEFVGARSGHNAQVDRVIDASGLLVLPGFIDLQVNGGGGYLYTESQTIEQIDAINLAHATTGTTSLFATIISDSDERMCEALRLVAESIENPVDGSARVIGIHIEGPYLNPKKRGGHAAEHLKLPTVEHFSKLWEASRGHISMVSLAPELDGAADLISHLHQLGVKVAVAHSLAGIEDMSKAVAQGLEIGTHILNAMETITAREPGTVGSLLMFDQLKVGLIGDLVHVHPMNVRLVLRMKGVDNVFLVTDAVSPLGTTQSSFKLYGVDVLVRDGGCYTPEGVLAGSATPLHEMIRRLIDSVGLSIGDAVSLATMNPALICGVADRKGSLKAGYDADIVVCDTSFGIQFVLSAGKEVLLKPGD